MTNYLKINKSLFFTHQIVKPEAQKEKLVEVNTHHIFVIDCSGSMHGELSKIRKDLHNKISTSLKPNDSVTIIWFSGSNQFGIVIEDYTVSGAVSLQKLKETIDKFLTSQGLTAFKQPLEEVKRVVDRVSKDKKGYLHSMFFLTDGCDNCWPTKDIIKATESLKETLNGATIVEYGWYCNRELMSNMAQALGGVHTVSKDFTEYEPYLTKQFSNDNKGKRKYIQLSETPEFGVVFNIVDGDVIMYTPNENNEVLISVDGETSLFFFTKNVPTGKLLGGPEYFEKIYQSGQFKTDELIKGAYAAMFAFSRKSDFNTVSEILKATGDAHLIKIKANTFGTQKITELEQKFVDAINDEKYRFIEGYDPTLEPAEDAYCVLDMISDLMSHEDNVWFPQHESFNYKKIGSKTVSKAGQVSQEDKDKLDKLLKENNLSDLQDAIEDVKSKQVQDLEFHYNNVLQPSPIADLVWNQARANLSVLVKYDGYVELPANEHNIATKFDTFIFRNYTLIKDGIIHMYNLPVALSQDTFNALQSHGLLKGESFEVGKIYVLDFSQLPVINRKMVDSLSATDLFQNEYELVKLQAGNSYFNNLKNKLFKNASQKFKEIYGEEATAWLETLGIKEGGFNPAKLVEKSGEEIVVNTLEIKIEKLSSSVGAKDIESAEKKIDSGASLTPKESLIEPYIQEYKQFQKLLPATGGEKILEDWLYAKSKNFRSHKSKLMTEISKAKFLTIVGKSWFKEFTDRSQKEMTLNLDSRDIKFTVEDDMKTVKL
jgi:uncharacterized protein YegL